jgi:hypothetical protein
MLPEKLTGLQIRNSVHLGLPLPLWCWKLTDRWQEGRPQCLTEQMKSQLEASDQPIQSYACQKMTDSKWMSRSEEAYLSSVTVKIQSNKDIFPNLPQVMTNGKGHSKQKQQQVIAEINNSNHDHNINGDKNRKQQQDNNGKS